MTREPSPPPQPVHASSQTLARRLWAQYVAPRWRLVLIAMVLMAATAAASSSYAFIVQWAVSLFEAQDSRVIWLAPAVISAAALFKGVTLYLQVLQTNRLALSVMRELQEDMFSRLLSADYARIAAESAGSLVSRFINDVNLLREALIRAANNLVRDVLIVIGAVSAMFWFDWMLAVLVCVVYPLAAWPVTAIGRRLRRVSADAQVQMGGVTSFLEESFPGARMVKTYGLERYQRDRAQGAFMERFRYALTLAAGKARVDPILEVLGGVAIAGVLGFAGWRTSTGASSIADLIGFIAAIGIMAPAVRAIGTLSAVAQEGFAALDRIFALMDEPPAIANRPGAKPLDRVRGEVALKDVHFAYADGNEALKGVSLTASAGETVALVGPSGAGKSTVLNLIPRLYDVTEGAVTVDGRDVRDLTIASLRGQIATVSQNVVLFDDTVLAFGKLDASEEAIIEAAKAAAAHDFIAAMEGGYDAPVGPKGERLSGGERQRIALARAFLKDAPILLLDEATSALDAESERKVQEAIQRLAKGRTTLVIAHRLATVRDADRIYVFENGQIKETGTHDALMAEGGLYSELAKLQFREG